MFILIKDIFNKIFAKDKSQELYKEKYESLLDENKKLYNNNKQLKEINLNQEQINHTLKHQNKQLLNENKFIKNDNKRLEKLNSFITFQEFLAKSYTSPIINAPFQSVDKRIFAFMDHISKYLIKKSKKIENKPLVSVIMYTYNKEHFIIEAINSVFKQTYKNLELIIIDDGSTDNTVNKINEKFNYNMEVIVNKQHKGHSFSFNTALKIAKGDYLMFLDSTSKWDSKFVETMIGAFMELPDADIIYSGTLLYKEYNKKPYAMSYGSYNRLLLHNKNYIDISSFCCKNYVYNHVGEFDETLTSLYDWDYIVRCSNKMRIYSVPVLLLKKFEFKSFNQISGDEDYYKNASNILNRNDIPIRKYDKLSHRISIIIPNYESLKELKECVETILSLNSGNMVDIIIVDNNSSVVVKEYLNKLESNEMIKIIYNNVNYGFTYAVKQGIDFSDENTDILILNNDAILTEGALEHMQKGAYSYNNCGIIVPHEIVSKQNPHMKFHVPYSDSNFGCDITPSKAHHNIINMPIFHDGELLELNFAPFFCTYIKREIYNKTIGLDPELGRHYRSDHIFSDFVRHILKMKIYQEPDAYVYHKQQAATNILKKNKEEYDMIFIKNQWPLDLSKKLGYNQRPWD